MSIFFTLKIPVNHINVLFVLLVSLGGSIACKNSPAQMDIEQQKATASIPVEVNGSSVDVSPEVRLKKIFDTIISIKSKNLDNDGFYSLDSRRISLCRTNYAKGEDFSAHGTNGFALLLAIFSGKQLLPGNAREALGIPTITGEAQYINKNSDEAAVYHNKWQNFVFTIDLQTDTPNLDKLREYAKLATHRFADSYLAFKDKLHKALEGTPCEDMLCYIDNESMGSLYEELCGMNVIILGDGIGSTSTDYCNTPYERLYERVNIRAVVVPAQYEKRIHELFASLQVSDIGVLGEREFWNFNGERQKRKNELCKFMYRFEEKYGNHNIGEIPRGNDELQRFLNGYGHDNIDTVIDKFGNIALKDFCDPFNDDYGNYVKQSMFLEDFINTFGHILPCTLYRSTQAEEIIIDKEIKYKNSNKSIELEKTEIKYALPMVSVGGSTTCGDTA